MTVVNGEILLENGEFTKLDEEEIIHREQKEAEDLIEKTDFTSAVR